MSRFVCTPAGSVAAGRRKLRLILLGPAALMLAGTVISWSSGRIFPGLLGVGIAILLYSIWRMANRHEPLYLELQGESLEVRLRWQLFHVPLEGARARVLSTEEREHLERLVSIGGMVSTTGGYDSHRLGEFDLYASDLQHSVLLETEETRYVLTPDDPDGFVRAVGTIHAS